MTPTGFPDTTVDPTRPEIDSTIADALTALGPNGERALGHLRTAAQMLGEPSRWPQPFETVLGSCRSAIDSLLKEAGEEFEGPRDAQDRVNREVEALLGRPVGQRQSPLEKLIATLDSADVPDTLEPKAGIGAGVQRLIKIPDGRLPNLADPGPEHAALRAFLDAVTRLQSLPSAADDQQELIALLRQLRQARQDSGAAAAAAQPDFLNDLRLAWAYRQRERQDGGAFRRRQVAHIVSQRTGYLPGLGEEEALRAWSVFYQRTSGALHGGSTDEASTRKLFADLLAHVKQLLLDLPDLASLLVPLARVETPTAADAEAVAAVHQRRAIRWFFTNAVSCDWLDLVSEQRLRPEAAHWLAQPFLERVGTAQPQRALAWLERNRDAFTGADPVVLAGLLRVARAIGGLSAPLVRDIRAKEIENLPALWHQVVVWLVDVPANDRDVAWVEVAKRVLLHVVELPAGQRWELQQQLAELQKAAYGPDGVRDAVTVRAVRSAMMAVVEAAVRSELEIGDLDRADDLRQPVSADDFGPTATRIAVRALLDFARTEFRHGVDVADRTFGWRRLPGPSRWADRTLAAHLLESAPQQQDDSAASQSWRAATRDVLARLGDTVVVGADTVDLVAVTLASFTPDILPVLEAELATALGPAPTGADLDAGLSDLARWAAPPGWSRAWSLSPVLPPAVLAPWQSVVDAVTAQIGPAPIKPLNRFRIVPYLDTLTATAQDLAPVAAEQGAPAAAALLLEKQRTGVLSPDYARIVLQQLIATDPACWARSVSAVGAALADPALRQSYLAALRSPLTADPCPLPDPAGTAAEVIGALWDLLAEAALDESVLKQAQLSLCLALSEAWTRGVDLGTIGQPIAGWLEAVVTTWTEPTSSASHPIVAAHSEIGGLALDALIRFGLTFAQVPAELTTSVETVLDGILDAGTDDRALAVIGHHLPALLQQAPVWSERHRGALFDVDRPACPAVLGIASRRTVDYAGLQVLRRLDPAQLAAYLSRTSSDDTENAAVWVNSAALLLTDPDALGGRREFLTLLTGHDGGPAAISRLLGEAQRLLPYTATKTNGPEFETGADLWRDILALDLPASAGHLRGAGNFTFTKALDDAVWMELTLLTVERTPEIAFADSVARRAAQHPDSEAAHRILTCLVPLCDPKANTGIVSYRLDEIERGGKALWKAAQPNVPGRKELGQALARHVDFLEGMVD